jgi:mortality factor 4-like protein 1
MVRKEREPQGWRPNAGDRVICISTGMSYEARVLTVGKDPKDNDKNPETKYYVHYNGWNKNWDEWVRIDRLKEFSEDNMKYVDETAKKVKSSRGPGSGRKRLGPHLSRANASTTSLSQSSLDESVIVEPEKPVCLDKEVKIKIPEELKAWLIDDDDNIKNKKLTVLPAKPPITTILKDFITFKKTSSRNINEAVLGEMTLGIKDYFNVMLGSHLLYKFERLQYQHLLKDQGKDVDLATHYGVIHLVRLFTKIGKILAHSTLEPQNVQTIINYMQELLKYVSKQTALFDSEKNYTVAPPEYIKNALK